MLERLFGPHDPRRAMVISNRGMAELACGYHMAALASQTEALQILEDTYGGTHRDTKLASARLADLLPHHDDDTDRHAAAS